MARNRLDGISLLRRFERVRKLRPAVLGTLITRLQVPDDRRRIVETDGGLRIYLDPFTHLGQSILTSGSYEPATEEIFREHLRPGETFLDVGANEGYFSALAGALVGSTGTVIAIEPQSRLRDIIELNLILNQVQKFKIYNNALGGIDGDTGHLNLWPTFNSGASSILRKYRFSTGVQPFMFISLDRVFAEVGVDSIDFVKIDVEGFEAEVIHHAGALLKAKKLRKILVDYHQQILTAKGIVARTVHDEILSCGYRMLSGNQDRFDSYFLYESI